MTSAHFHHKVSSYAIIRVEKVKTRQALVQREKHNDRTKETPNAVPERLDWNKEYVNLDGRPMLELLDARVAEAGVGRPRANATICMEILLTGGPEAEVWRRQLDKEGKPGLAADMRGSQWEVDIVAFAHREWGKNLLSLRLHQDELTPHFQAFVAPLVSPEGGRNGEVDPQNPQQPLPPGAPARRSARDLFSPPRLARLQTDYAAVVEPHGFKRGISGSRAHHKTMAQMYGLLEKTTVEIEPFLEAGQTNHYKLAPPSNPLQWSKWLRETEADINSRLRGLEDKLTQAGQIAVAAAGGSEASARSRAWIEQEKQRKVDLGKRVEESGVQVMCAELQLDSANHKVRELTYQLEEARAREARLVEQHAAQQDTLARHGLQGTLPAEVVERAQQQLRAARDRARVDVAEALALPVANEEVVYERLRRRGYRWAGADANKLPYLVDGQTGARFRQAQVQPGGAQGPELTEQITQAVAATQQAEERERQASYARQQASWRENQRQQHLAHEEWALGRFRSSIGNPDYAVARIRVPAEHVAGVEQQQGRNTVHVDEKPGSDGLVGINLCYTPTASGKSASITDTLEWVQRLGGEVYEAAPARATRELRTNQDRERARGYSPGKSREQERGL